MSLPFYSFTRNEVKKKMIHFEYKYVLVYTICRSKQSFILYLLTYLLTPWCRVLPEQLTALQLVKKFPAFHGTRRFITALTSVRHLSLSWARPIIVLSLEQASHL